MKGPARKKALQKPYIITVQQGIVVKNTENTYNDGLGGNRS